MADTATTATFRSLHEGPGAFVIPNAWDAGSAKVLASLGFAALATTSSGYAMTLGRRDGGATRAEVLEHVALLSSAVAVPVSDDLEHGYADDPAGVAETVRLAGETGLAGCSIEDSTGQPADPIYPAEHAADRVRAAVEAARATGLVLTARAEGLLWERSNLADVIARLQSFQEAGADVLFAPGLRELEDIRTVVSEVDLPVNVLAWAGGPSVAELSELGVRRISVGGSLAWNALGSLVDAAVELRDQGTVGYGAGMQQGRQAFLDALG
jgi:2-methylisocitrate lyase-like PEP mutase family enzyme